jgi:hypothetical protein
VQAWNIPQVHKVFHEAINDSAPGTGRYLFFGPEGPVGGTEWIRS